MAKKKTEVSRRDFLKKSAALGVGAVVVPTIYRDAFAACLGSATLQLFGPNRQFSNALAGGGEDGVGNSRGERRHTRLSDSARGCFARSDVDLDDRHFVDP